jgi:membrane-bound serine protease (ClpP class)
MSSLAWSIILLIAALCVVGIEMFIPSAGLLAIVSGSLFLAALIVAFFHSLTAGVFMLIAIGLLLPVMFVIFVNVWPNTPIGKRILLKRMGEDDVLLRGEHYDEQQDLVGKTGIARSEMIPSGQVMIDGRKYDAVSEGLPIDKGDHIKVVSIRMFKIFVRKIDPNEAAVATSSLEDDDLLSQPVDDVFDTEI